jgi:predicted ABC-type ATPase
MPNLYIIAGCNGAGKNIAKFDRLKSLIDEDGK